MQLSRRSALLSAFALSFAVYLTPLFNVHAGWVPLAVFFAGFIEPSIISLAMASAAVLLQILAFGLVYWSLRRPGWVKGLVMVAVVPVFIAIANWSFLYGIPHAVLVEADTKPERGELNKVCSVAGATIAQVHSGTDLSLVRAGEVWLILDPGRKRARLTMPDCQVHSVAAPKVGSTMDRVAAGGYLLYRGDNGSLAYAATSLKKPVTLSAPAQPSYWNPVLSDDGAALVWLDRKPMHSGLRPHRLRIRHLRDGREETIALKHSARDQLELIGAVSHGGPFTVAQYRNKIFSYDIHGQKIRGPIEPSEIYNARWGFRWVKGGWVAWDGYREDGRHRIVWALPTGRGTIVIPRGRGIEALSLAADGSFIAASVSTNLNIGSTNSAVFLVRTDNNEEVYRRYLPMYARTRLAFIGTRYLAMTRSENEQSFVDVYRIPNVEK
ncbi:MAG: hypothetical protein HKN28_06060 [Alphaproteobacteria bacterium]|nr:hypothetical protein [Alphaproteobacteria bacterium]